MVSVLQRTLSSHSIPQTSRRPSVIKQTPPTTPQHSLAKELATQLEDLEAKADFNLRNYPANELDEIALVEDYEESLSEMKRICIGFSKVLKKLTSQLDPTALEGWLTNKRNWKRMLTCIAERFEGE